MVIFRKMLKSFSAFFGKPRRLYAFPHAPGGKSDHFSPVSICSLHTNWQNESETASAFSYSYKDRKIASWKNIYFWNQ